MAAAEVALIDELLAARMGERALSALDSLEMSRRGWPERAYHAEGIAIWEENLDANPDDIETLHHLAIAYHARAIDQEMANRGIASDADWRRALELWHQLWESDEFWRTLASRAGQGTEGVDEAATEVRRSMPANLLRVHFDIALDPGVPIHRRRHHVGLAAKSAFPSEHFKRAREEAFQDLLGKVPDEWWVARDAATLYAIAERIESFLEADPTYDKALAEVLKVLTRWMRLQAKAHNAESSHGASPTLALIAAAQHWESYWKPFTSRRRNELDPAVLEELSAWYDSWVQACMVEERWDEARRIFESFNLFSEERREELVKHFDRERIGDLLKRALAAREARRPIEAERLLTEAIGIRPLPELYLYRCLARAESRNLAGAWEDLAKAKDLGAPLDDVLEIARQLRDSG